MNRRRKGKPLPVYQTCSCGKTYAPTLRIAKNLKREITARTGVDNEVRFYLGRCGSWHWTAEIEPLKPYDQSPLKETA